MKPHPDERNPEHPVTVQMREEWHKLCALLMQKFNVDRVEITMEDVDKLGRSPKNNIMVHAHRSSPVITLLLVDLPTAERLQRENPEHV